ncbi:hypothetical protein [Halorubrum halophilum]|uniref:hypothetical protein n=1 Tax=Halorubrum halophilum TaxID=413816 RepID=UPI00186B2DAA|nr:hypothetical protein [Halorubrum halophilum]
MVSDATDDADSRPDAATDSPLAARWLALDRGWQALALGIAVVGAHFAGQAAGLF